MKISLKLNIKNTKRWRPKYVDFYTITFSFGVCINEEAIKMEEDKIILLPPLLN